MSGASAGRADLAYPYGDYDARVAAAAGRAGYEAACTLPRACTPRGRWSGRASASTTTTTSAASGSRSPAGRAGRALLARMGVPSSACAGASARRPTRTFRLNKGGKTLCSSARCLSRCARSSTPGRCACNAQAAEAAPPRRPGACRAAAVDVAASAQAHRADLAPLAAALDLQRRPLGRRCARGHGDHLRPQAQVPAGPHGRGVAPQPTGRTRLRPEASWSPAGGSRRGSRRGCRTAGGSPCRPGSRSPGRHLVLDGRHLDAGLDAPVPR